LRSQEVSHESISGQQSAWRRTSANFLAAICSGKFLESSIFALCNQLTADELSHKAKKHDSGSIVPFKIAAHTDINAAVNSSELFCLWHAVVSMSDNLYCQARPKESYPLMPWGQASDQLMTEGRL